MKISSSSFIASLAEKEKKKIGRPLQADKPLKNSSFRILTEEETERFNEYAKEQNKTKAQILREFVLSLIDK